MEKWEKELKKRSYTLDQNGRVLDDVDALQVGRLAEKEAWNQCLDMSHLKLTQGNLYTASQNGELYQKIKEILDKLKK